MTSRPRSELDAALDEMQMEDGPTVACLAARQQVEALFTDFGAWQSQHEAHIRVRNEQNHFIEKQMDKIFALRSEVERVTKDAERLDWLQEQVRSPNPDKDSAYQTCIGEVVLSGSFTDVSVEVGNAIYKGEGPTLREAIDRARGAVRGDAAIPTDKVRWGNLADTTLLAEVRRIMGMTHAEVCVAWTDAGREWDGKTSIQAARCSMIHEALSRDAAIREDAPCEACDGTGNGSIHGVDEWCNACGGDKTQRAAPVQPPREDAPRPLVPERSEEWWLTKAKAEEGMISAGFPDSVIDPAWECQQPNCHGDASTPCMHYVHPAAVQPPADREPHICFCKLGPALHYGGCVCECGAPSLCAGEWWHVHCKPAATPADRLTGIDNTVCPAPADEQEFTNAIDALQIAQRKWIDALNAEYSPGKNRERDDRWLDLVAARTEVMRLYREMGESKRPTPLTKHDSGK